MAEPAYFNSGLKSSLVEADRAVVNDLSCLMTLLEYGSQNIASSANILSLSGEKPFVRITGSTETAIHGISKTHSKVIFIFNATDKTVTMINNSSEVGVAVDEKISTPSGANVAIQPNSTMGWMRDPVTNLWVIQSGSGEGGGGGFSKIDKVTSSTTLTVNHQCVLVDASAGNIVLTLPPVISKKEFIFKRTDNSTNTVTILAVGADTIDGLGSDTIPYQYDSLKIVGIDTGKWGKF